MLPTFRRHLRLAGLSLRLKTLSALASAMLLVGVAACGLATADNLSGNGGIVGDGTSNGTSNGTKPPEGPAPLVPDGSSAGDIQLRGTFGPTAVAKLARRLSTQAGAHLRAADDIRALFVHCTVHGPTLRTAVSQLADDGSFVVTLAGARNQLVGCSLLDDANALLANLTFQGGRDLEGNAAAAHEVALSASADVGRAYYDDTTFEAAINADTIAKVRAPAAGAADALDLTGRWTVTPVDFALPADATAPCAAGATTCLAGFAAGDTLRALRLAGTRAADKTPTWVLQVWDAPAQLDACGGRVGLSPAALAAAGLDFTAAGAAADAFTYSASLHFTDAVTGSPVTSSTVDDGWRLLDAAVSRAAVANCWPQRVPTNDGNQTLTVCGPDANNVWRVSGATGCRNAATGRSSAAVPTAADWAQATCSTAAAGANLTSYSCTLTVAASGEAVRCSAVQGDFADALLTTPAPAGPVFTDTSVGQGNALLPAGAPCANLDATTPAGALAQRSCYAAFVASSKVEDADDACLPQVAVNAAEPDPAAQLQRNLRPKHLRHADLFVALAGGTGGTVTTRRHETYPAWASSPGLQATPLSCATVLTRSLNVVKISPTRLLATYTEQRGTDDLRPACLAAFANGAVHTVMYLDKQ